MLKRKIMKTYFDETFMSETPETSIPNFKENSLWYERVTLGELSAIWRSIDQHPNSYTVIAQAAFSSILRSASSRRGPANRVADNIHPNSLTYRSAIGLFTTQLEAHRRGSRYLNRELKALAAGDTVACETAFQFLRTLPDDDIDLAIAELPSLGTVDFVRSQRLTSLWFGWSLADYSADEIGARFKRRGIGARGEYLTGLGRVFGELGRVVRPGHWCALVTGIVSGHQELNDELCKALEARGFMILGRIIVPSRAGLDPLGRKEILIARRTD
jgi:hypothetical protein